MNSRKHTRLAGVWIDYRKAVVALLDGEHEALVTVVAATGRHATDRNQHGTVTSIESHSNAAQSQRKAVQQQDRYFDRVIQCLQNVDELNLFGPGQAKYEFQRRLQYKWPGRSPRHVDTVGKMTDVQVIAHTKKYLAHEQQSF